MVSKTQSFPWLANEKIAGSYSESNQTPQTLEEEQRSRQAVDAWGGDGVPHPTPCPLLLWPNSVLEADQVGLKHWQPT